MKAIKTNILALLAGVSVLACAGCGNGNGSSLNDLETSVFTVKTGVAERRTLENSIILPGNAKAWQEAVIFPRAAGKLRQNLLSEGDSVKKDQTIALIERDEVGVVHKPMVVPATIDGVIGMIYQDVGTNVSMQTPIASVVNQTKIRMSVNIPERYLGMVFKGQPASIETAAYPGRVFRGRIYKLSPVVDEASLSTVAEILIDNGAGLLKTGMFGHVSLILKRHDDAVAVPLDALVTEEGQKYVFLADKDNRAVKIAVTAGIETRDYIEIVKGIRPGDRIIVFGLYGLQNGSRIKIVS
ncbi:MAG: efflux RND transporter periplasmic adaptor subunit [Elusimicrobiaceae bacterium]|nr:efflux RND transporter periplasmic adaptor subunit [Elusimicrobiaceae bacterium]